MTTYARTRHWPALVLVAALIGCEAGTGSAHRTGDPYERNNMPSAAPDRPAGPHSLNTDDTGDFQSLHQSR